MRVINVLTPAVMLWVYIASPKSTFGHVTVISIVSPTQALYPVIETRNVLFSVPINRSVPAMGGMIRWSTQEF